MNILSIVQNDAVNSITGFTTSIYIAGCEHHCKGCFSPQTWDNNQGKSYTVEELIELISLSKNKNVSLIGGDPFNPIERLSTIKLIKKIKLETNKILYVWSGYSKEQIEQWIDLSLIDYLIEGKFMLEQLDIRLNLRGSKNQRIFNKGIDITNEIDSIK